MNRTLSFLFLVWKLFVVGHSAIVMHGKAQWIYQNRGKKKKKKGFLGQDLFFCLITGYSIWSFRVPYCGTTSLCTIKFTSVKFWSSSFWHRWFRWIPVPAQIIAAALKCLSMRWNVWTKVYEKIRPDDQCGTC